VLHGTPQDPSTGSLGTTNHHHHHTRPSTPHSLNTNRHFSTLVYPNSPQTPEEESKKIAQRISQAKMEHMEKNRKREKVLDERYVTLPRHDVLIPPKPSTSTHHNKWIYFQAGDLVPEDHRAKVFPFGLSIAIDKAEPYNIENIRLTADALSYISQLDLGMRHTCNSFAKLGTKQVKGIRLTLFGPQIQIENAPWECYRGLISEQYRARGSTLMKIPLSLAITDIDRPITQVLSPPIPTHGKLRDTYEEFVSAYTHPDSGSIGESLLHNSQDPAYNIHLMDNEDANGIQPGRIPKQFYPYLNIANALVNDHEDHQLSTTKPHLYFIQAMYRAMLSPSVVTKYSWPFGKTLYVMRNDMTNDHIIETIMKSPTLQLFCFLGDRVQDSFNGDDLNGEETTILDVENPEHRRYIRLNFGRKFLDQQVRIHQFNQQLNRETTFRELLPENAKPRDSMDILNKLWPAEMFDTNSSIPHPDRPTLLKLKEAIQKRTKAHGGADSKLTSGEINSDKNHLKLVTISEAKAQRLEFERSLEKGKSVNKLRTGFLMREKVLRAGSFEQLDDETKAEDNNNEQNLPQVIPNQKKRTIVRSTSRTLAQIIRDGDYTPDVTENTVEVKPQVLLHPTDGEEISMKNQIFEVALDPLMMGMLHPHIPLHKIRNLLYKQIKRNKDPPNIASDYVHLIIKNLATIPPCSIDLPMVNGITRAQGLIQQSAAAVGLNSFTDRNSTFLKTHSLAMTMSHIISRTLDFPKKYSNDYYEWKVYEQHQMDAIAILRTASDVFQLSLEKHKNDLVGAIDEKRKKKETQIRQAFLRKVKRGDKRYHPDDINKIHVLNISDSEDEGYAAKRKIKLDKFKKIQAGELPPDAIDDNMDEEDEKRGIVVATPSFAFLQLPSKILHIDQNNANQPIRLDEKQDNTPVVANQLRPTTMMLPYLDFLNHAGENNQHNVSLSFDLAETSVVGNDNEVQKRRDEIKEHRRALKRQEDMHDDEELMEKYRADPDNYDIDEVTGKPYLKDELQKDPNDDPSKAIETMISNDDIDRVQRLIVAMQVEIQDLEEQLRDEVVIKIANHLPLTSFNKNQHARISRPTEIQNKISHLHSNIKMLEKALDVVQVPNRIPMANVVARRDIFPGEELFLAYHRLDDADPYITSVSNYIPADKQDEALSLQSRQQKQANQLDRERARHHKQLLDDLKSGTKEIQDRFDADIIKVLKLVQEIQSDIKHLDDIRPAFQIPHKPGSIDAITSEKLIQSQRDNIEQQKKELQLKLAIANDEKNELFDKMYKEVEELHRRDEYQKRQTALNQENYRWTQMTPQQLLLNYGIVLPHLHLTPVALQHLDHESAMNATQGSGLHGMNLNQVDNPLASKTTKVKDYLKLQEQRRAELEKEKLAASKKDKKERMSAQDAVIHAKMVSHGAIPIMDENMAIHIGLDGEVHFDGTTKSRDSDNSSDEAILKQPLDSKTTTVALRKQTIGEQMQDEVDSANYNINPHIEPFSLVLNLEEMALRHIGRKANQMDFIPDVGLKEKLKIMTNAKEIIELDSLLLESREILDLINKRITLFEEDQSGGLFQDLDDVKMSEVSRHYDASVQLDRKKHGQAAVFSYEDRIQILKDRVAVESAIDNLQTRREELDYVTRQGMVQTSLVELFIGNSTKKLPPLHCSLAAVNTWASKYGFSTAIDRKTKKVLRHVDTNLEEVIHFVLDDVYQYQNNLHSQQVYKAQQEFIQKQEEIINQSSSQDKHRPSKRDSQEAKRAKAQVQFQNRLHSSNFIQDLLTISDKDARGTLLACRLLYETIATTWLEQVVMKDFVSSWETMERPKHLHLFSKFSHNHNSGGSGGVNKYIIGEDISFRKNGSKVSNRDLLTEEKVQIMKNFMLTKVPHPLQLMEQAYKSIWLDNSLENTNKRKLKSKITKKARQINDDNGYHHHPDGTVQHPRNPKSKKNPSPNELSDMEDSLSNRDRPNKNNDDDDDDDDESEETEVEDDHYQVDRHFYLDDDYEENIPTDSNNKSLLSYYDKTLREKTQDNLKFRQRFNAQKYLDEVNTLYENINYKVQTHVGHEDFGDFLHMTNTCEILGAYRKQQLDTMIYIYTHFYDKLERL
jgi:hypothetical protein